MNWFTHVVYVLRGKKQKKQTRTDTSTLLCQWDRQETAEQIHLSVIIFQGQDITQVFAIVVELVQIISFVDNVPKKEMLQVGSDFKKMT